MKNSTAISAFLCMLLLTAGGTLGRGEPFGTQTPGGAPAQNPASPGAALAPSTPATSSTIDPVKEADIRNLLEVVGVRELSNQTMGAMETSIRPLLEGSLPAGEYRAKLVELFLAKFKTKFSGQQTIDMAVPVYDKYFSDPEIKELTKFYATPLGKKTVTTLPKLMADLQSEGAKYGREAGKQSMMEVLAEHPELQQEMEEAAKKAKGN